MHQESSIFGLSFRNLQSLAQTGHIVSAVYLVLVCKKGSNAILKSAPGRAEIRNRSILHCLPISKYLLACENGFNMPAIG